MGLTGVHDDTEKLCREERLTGFPF
jgi:hypothetical protein